MAAINPQIFRPIEPDLPAIPGVDTAVIEPITKTVPVGLAPAGQADVRGAAVRAQADTFQEANWFASLGAGLLSTDTANAYRYLTKPEFEATENEPTAFEQMQHLPFVLSPDEQEAFQKEPTAAGRQWLAERFKETRDRAEVAGQHGSAMLLSQWIDPAYLLVGGVAGFGTKAIRGAAVARTVGAGVTGLGAAGVSAAASQVAPMSDGEFALNVALNLVGGAMVSKGGKLSKLDPDYPENALRGTLDEFYKDFIGPAPHGVDDVVKPVVKKVGNEFVQTGERTIRRAKTPDALLPGAGATQEAVVQAVEAEARKQGIGEWFGSKVGWNLHKDISTISTAGAEVADVLVDNNRNLGMNSVESIKRAVHADLTGLVQTFDDTMRTALSGRGFGTLSMIFRRSEAIKAQRAIEREVRDELLRRESLHRLGLAATYENVHPTVKKLADQHGAVMDRALAEMKARGVLGAEELEKNPGYFSRSWSSSHIEDVRNAFRSMGLPEKEAHQRTVQFLKRGIMRANPNMADPLAYDVAASMIDRAIRKGYLMDGPAGAAVDAGTLAQLRDRLKAIGVKHENMEKVLEIVGGKVDEAGKASFLKHRMNVDFNEAISINGQTYKLGDMLESNMTTIMDKYVDRVSGRIAMHEKGLSSTGEIQKLRERFVAGAAQGDRARADWLFEQSVNKIMGLPTGAELNQTMRNASAVGRMVALGSSGMWQLTEYATQMQKYGMLKTLKHAMKELPVFRTLMDDTVKSVDESRRLNNILSNAAEQNFRLRPFIERFEDNFEIPQGSALTLQLQQGTQLVPYVNGMKYIHSHQARLTANLITDALDRAANGSPKYRDMLKRYGVEAHIMDRLSREVKAHGMDVDKWDDNVWASVRPSFIKMMDEAVLHQRMGDVPAFAQFSEVGKFIFTFRSFVLTAHNKLLAGTAAREGAGASSLMMLYQFPLALLATQANSVISGKGVLDEQDLVKKSIGQMGSIGLFSELYGWLSGNKNEVGSPGLIPFDRTIRAGQSTASAIFGDGSGTKAANDVGAAIPIFAITPGIKAFQYLE